MVVVLRYWERGNGLMDWVYIKPTYTPPGRLEAFLEEQALEDERAAAEYAGY